MALIKRKPNKLGGGDGGQGQGSGANTVIYGIHRLDNQKLAGKTVGEVRKLLVAWEIDPKAVNTVNGQEATGKRVLKDGETLEFVKQAGAKG